ncbi:MAG: hypothetical protein CMC86_05065 [Flavobacteriaceae bacterium]|nr:hypothetical protein [Flavobacteriaceae bacterium]|tara:strand:- start:55 stop:510 length:456 start_codon:yes stop_codon:yes gene_type:complete
MKSILKIFIFLFSISLVAQQPKRSIEPDRGKRPNHRIQAIKKLNPEQAARLWSKKMTLDLDLNQIQEDQMYALILEKTNKIRERMENKPKKHPNKDEIYQIKLDKLNEEIAMKKRVKNILSEKQYILWDKSLKKKKTLEKRRSKLKKKGRK